MTLDEAIDELARAETYEDIKHWLKVCRDIDPGTVVLPTIPQRVILLERERGR